jgi:hypothetical protein
VHGWAPASAASLSSKVKEGGYCEWWLPEGVGQEGD